MRHVTIATAAATFLSQIPSVPLDLASKLIQPCVGNAPQNLCSALIRLFATSGIRGAFKNLPMACVKRIPTKALTVAFFEIGTQVLGARQKRTTLSPVHHLGVAVSAGALALALTFPLHSLYYANRKGLACGRVFSVFSKRWQLMFSGALPALMSTPPAVMVDYLVYKRLRSYVDEGHPDDKIMGIPAPVWIVGAAATSNLAGGVLVEPFKAVSRKMAIESVTRASCGSFSLTTRTMMRCGLGEFWKGYKNRMVRYAISAVVSKTTVRHLRRMGSPSVASGKTSFLVGSDRRRQAAAIQPPGSVTMMVPHPFIARAKCTSSRVW